jgi:beta-lactamase class D
MRSVVMLAVVAALASAWIAAPVVESAGAGGSVPPPARAGDEAWDAGWRDVEGTLVVVDRATGRTWRHDAERAAARFSPCSTFKIPHTLIGLELGLLEGPETTFRFDPQRFPRGPQQSDARWRTLARDHDLRSAMRESVVWYYRMLAPQIGAARMSEWLARFEYGNRDISSGIDAFWLEGSLLVSADEQLRFLERLHDGAWGSPRSLAVLREILEVERGPDWRLLAKTGLGRTPQGRPLGWWVGWVERPAGPLFFAANLEADDWATVQEARVRLVRETLGDLGLVQLASGP